MVRNERTKSLDTFAFCRKASNFQYEELVPSLLTYVNIFLFPLINMATEQSFKNKSCTLNIYTDIDNKKLKLIPLFQTFQPSRGCFPTT